jgi:hypothetical protein
MKVISGSKVNSVLNGLSAALKNRLESKWKTHTPKEYVEEYPFKYFFGDLVREVAYRKEQGIDGNWTEFATTYALTDEEYQSVLNVMIQNGFTSNMKRWE